MRKTLLTTALLLISFFAVAAYQNGDQVADFTWQDSDGGTPVSRTVSSITGANKVLLITWGYLG